MYDGVVYVTRVENPTVGVTYTVTSTDGVVLGSATATEADATAGSLDIELNEKANATNTVAPVTTNDRITVAGNQINVKLAAGDDLTAISKQYSELKLDKAATAVVAGLAVELPVEGAITKILNTLTENGKTAADLVTKPYEVKLYNPADVTVEGTEIKIAENAKFTTYTIQF